MRYAGFWSRFGALLIDALVIGPIAIVTTWLTVHSKPWTMITSVGFAVLVLVYDIYFHGRWGQSIGKMATGIKVVALDGSPIGWRRAFLRYSVDIGLAFFVVVFQLIAIERIPTPDFATMDMNTLTNLVDELAPVGVAWLDWAQVTWAWSELVVLLLNKERRALHDFIAGTVVVHVEK